MLAACGMLLMCAYAPAQPIQDSLQAKQERTRQLEREIGELEAKLAAARQDAVSVSIRLAEVERSILDYYMQIDQVESEVEASRKALNNSIKAMYVRGRDATIIRLMSSNDVSDFLAWYENMLTVVDREAEVFKTVKERRKRLRDLQERLAAFKREQATLNRSADTAAIEAAIELKKSEIAELSAVLISQQIPGTYVPGPSTFVPARVYARPDDNAFISTGQIFSGYSSWYGTSFDGKPTASGETFDDTAFTCAHKTLPFGTWLKVTFRNRSVIVKVNDRGPATYDRMVDVSKAAAEAIGLSGTQWVDCEIVIPRS